MEEGNSEQQSAAVQNSFSIYDIPEELLDHIMSHLSHYDRKLTRLVCKQWHEVSYSSSLIKNDWLVLPSVPSLKELQNFSDHWKFFNLRILEVGHEYEKSNVWERFGPKISKIELKDVSMQNPVLADIFQFCTDLRSLDLIGDVAPEDGISFANSAPPSLECLQLYGMFHLTDGEFNMLTKNALNVTEFYVKCYNFENSQDDCNTNSLVKVSSLMRFIQRQSTQLTHFEIAFTNLPDESLIGLMSSIGDQLKDLKIDLPSNLRGKCIQAISQNHPNIESITMQSSEVDSDDVSKLFDSLKKIKIFRINQVMTNFGSALSSISNLKFLTELYFSYCSSIRHPDLMRLCERSMPKIKFLTFVGMPYVTDEVIIKMAPMFPNLIHWCLNSTSCGDGGFYAIVKNNKISLQHLSMKACIGLTTVLPLINELTELRSLLLGSCKNIPPESFQELNLKNLRCLDLVRLYVNDRTLLSIVKNCPLLEQVSLHRCVKLCIVRPTFLRRLYTYI